MKKFTIVFLTIITIAAKNTSIAKSVCHASFSFQQTAGTLDVQFTDLSTSSNTITSWLWDFGDGSTSTLQNPTHTYPHDGGYFVCLSIHDDHGCSDQVCLQVPVIPVASVCQAAFSFQQAAGTLTMQFTDNSTSPNTITSWLWDFGDGNTSTSQNPSHTYTHDGSYYVCLTIHDNHGCTDQFCHHVTVNPVASCHASFTWVADTTGFITLTNTSTGTTANTNYYWTFGDGATSNSENPTHQYTHAGHYVICLFITDNSTGCSSHSCHHFNYLPHHTHHHPHHSAAFSNREANNLFTGNEISVYPVPAGEILNIRYAEPSANAHIELYSMDNRLIRSFDSHAGPEIFQLDLSSLEAGVYMLKVNLGQATYLRKMVKE